MAAPVKPACPLCGDEGWIDYRVGECGSEVRPCRECNAAGEEHEDVYREYMRYAVTGGI